MPTWYYFTRPINFAFHDCTLSATPPANLRSLLGLGLKFVPTPRFTTSPTDLAKPDGTLEKFNRSFKLHVYFGSTPIDNENNDYNPKMYVKSHWTPPDWSIPTNLMRRHDAFSNDINRLFRKQKRGSANLMSHQRRALSWLRRQDTFLIVNCDKNLGPAIMERTTYIQMAYRDHLNDPLIYRRLSAAEIPTQNTRLKALLSAWTTKHYKMLTIPERRFLKQFATESTDVFNTFYLLLKVHKPPPLKSRPVVSCSGSLLFPLGVWVDDKLQQVARAQRSYFKSSWILKNQLLALNLPPGTKFFSADARGMYTNIPTEQALRTIGRYLRAHPTRFLDVPVKALMEALTLIMKNNFFTFGDTSWVQLSGCAMGTPPAPPYATLCFAPHEDDCVDSCSNVFYYRRFIDDVIGLWTPSSDPATDAQQWTSFQRRLNEWNGLIWDFTPRSNELIFMDLTLSIRDGRITTSLYEKPLNLHLYIPPSSAHPPGLISGMVFGMLHRIHTLCTDPADQIHRSKTFFHQLQRRGWKRDVLLPLFIDGIKKAKIYTGEFIDRSNTTTIFFPLAYHPQDPPSRDIQRIWRNDLSEPPRSRSLATSPNNDGNEVGLNRMIVCYSRPPNLGNLLSYRKLPSLGPQASSFGITGE